MQKLMISILSALVVFFVGEIIYNKVMPLLDKAILKISNEKDICYGGVDKRKI